MSEPSSVRGALISGIGISRIGRRTGIEPLTLTTEAAQTAIADAGLSTGDIDAVSSMGDTAPDDAARALGITPSWAGGSMGRYGLLTPLVDACEAVVTGRSRHVLVYRTVNMLGGDALQGRRPDAPPIEPPPSMSDMPRLLTMHAYSAANWLAMHMRRHMHLYGTTREQVGSLAINSRRNAGRNPKAAYRDPITLDDYLNARPISEPFGLLDCDVPVDGSIALVVSDPSHASNLDHRAVRVESAGGSEGHGGWDQRPDYPMMAADDAAAELWRATDLRPADVNIAELYDGFTFLTLAWLEALGFCGRGESGSFVEGATRIALDGVLPLNTYGGQLSAGRMHGYWLLHEACLQLRGEAGDRQIPGGRPEVAACSVGGGPIAGCFLLTC
ncbi:MAG: thiolase family protein [Acidimicrobiaceae bacterium]|nr:thiolase family protein [Acidimicrobiaceae bacterium]